MITKENIVRFIGLCADQRMMYKIRSLRDQKQSMRKIASQLNISVATVHKACSEMVVEKTGAA